VVVAQKFKIEYMQKSIDKAVKALKNNKVILYPTDTVWGIGCDATNEQAIKKIYQIKERNLNKSLIVLVDSFRMLRVYVEIAPKIIQEYLKNKSKPITVIYEKPINLAKNAIANDGTIAIRIVQDEFCKKLISNFGKPIVSTSANISGELPPKNYKSIDEKIIEKVDFVVSLPTEIKEKNPSIIIKVVDGEIKILRD